MGCANDLGKMMTAPLWHYYPSSYRPRKLDTMSIWTITMPIFINTISFLPDLLEIIGPTYVFSAGSRYKIGRFVESAGTNPLVNSRNDRSYKFT